MFGPEYTAGCPSCSAIADGFNGSVVHLANHDVMLLGGVAGSAGETAGVQAADGLELPVGVLVRQRLQLRLPGDAHRGAVAVGSGRVQLPRDGRPAVAEPAARAPLAEIAASVGTDWATYTQRGPA